MKPPPLSPDGRHYLRMASGAPAPRPYCYRWLLPRLLGPYPARWQVLTWCSLAATPPLALAYFAAMGLHGWRAVFAAALLSSLPGLRLPFFLPVLIDAPTFALTLAVAALAASGHPWAAAALALPLGATRETAPQFAALWSWSLAPLAGFFAAGWFCFGPGVCPPDPSEPWLSHPYREAWSLRRRVGLDGSLYLRPWGAALAGIAAPFSWQTVATVVVAHAQLFAAVDTLRLAVWAAPVLVLRAAEVLPPWSWPLALVVTLIHRDDRA